MPYRKIPSIEPGQTKRRKERATLYDPEQKRSVKQTQDKRRPPFWAWIVILILAAFTFLTATSCSPAQKLEISRKWAEKYPETFTQIADTTFITREIPGDTIYRTIAPGTITAKPLKFETPKGLKLQIRKAGDFYEIRGESPARTDTIFKIREVFKDPPPPKFWFAPFWKEYLIIGFVLGILFLAIIKR